MSVPATESNTAVDLAALRARAQTAAPARIADLLATEPDRLGRLSVDASMRPSGVSLMAHLLFHLGTLASS